MVSLKVKWRKLVSKLTFKRERSIISNLIPSLVALIAVNGIISGYGVYVNGKTEKLIRQMGENSPTGHRENEAGSNTENNGSDTKYKGALKLRTRPNKIVYKYNKVYRDSSNNNDIIRRNCETNGRVVETEEFTKRVVSSITDSDKRNLQVILLKTIKNLLGQEATLKCVNCGSEIASECEFCNFCGFKVTQTCTCGTTIVPGAKFCHVCGAEYARTNNIN